MEAVHGTAALQLAAARAFHFQDQGAIARREYLITERARALHAAEPEDVLR